MREQAPAGRAVCRVLAGAEYDVPADRVSPCPYRLRGSFRTGIGMHPNVAEIVPEAGLHEAERVGVEWLPGRAQYLMHEAKGFAAELGRRPPGRLGPSCSYLLTETWPRPPRSDRRRFPSTARSLRSGGLDRRRKHDWRSPLTAESPVFLCEAGRMEACGFVDRFGCPQLHRRCIHCRLVVMHVSRVVGRASWR